MLKIRQRMLQELKELSNFRKVCLEKRVIGRVAVGGSQSILGRVRLFDESYTEGAILCVRGSEGIDREMLLLCPPLAVIVVCNENSRYIGDFCSLGVPCIIFDENEIGYDFCKNKVALIDTARGILTLNPSMDTLEFYSLSKKQSGDAVLSCASGKILKDIDIKESLKKQGVEHYFVSASAFEYGKMFDGAVDLWEALFPELLVFDMSVPKDVDGEERMFCERVEELFRAALYGSFAISLSGFDCESELALAMRLLHKTFCMLEAEGREFNGYLPRGITVSSPLWLMRPSPVTNPDFLIFDLDLLLPSLFSLSAKEIIKKEKALKKELLPVFERYFINFAVRCDIFLKTQYFNNTSLLSELVSRFNVKAVFYA